MLKGLRDFLMRGNVVDLAVAVVVGTAFNQVVNSLVADVITPLIGALGGAPDFSSIKLGPIALGKFLNALINFLIVGTAVYFLVVVPMQTMQSRLQKKAEEAPSAPPEPPEEVKLLREILEELRKKA
ncbi:large conductance mechanosensitive channel [Thermus arciformis]|uniref:Large-conductance mechanosensitive channel n=1 Tax=Thermus arciformis TaxID=482827 RepID=A0A1G7H1Z8_9DEIN|nr:large conductance mechanosensitive channel protein MscL [Thermus arciformis]SDE94361.1 large conductance mechanosensitive channel [Thermus arciformis]